MYKYTGIVSIFCLCLCVAGAAQAQCVRQDLFEPVDKHVHGSSIVQCPDGGYLACWFHGSGERTADDVQVLGARKPAGADAWSPVFPMADTPGFPDCNPVLYIDAEKRLWMFWIAVMAHGWENSLLKYRRADEYEGEGPPEWNWQGVIMLKPGEAFQPTIEEKFDELNMEGGMWAEYALPYTRMVIEAAGDPLKRQMGWMTRIHPLTLPSGRILLPLYSDGFNVSLVAISDDNGATWRASRPMVGAGPIQPTLVRRDNGDIVAYLRDSGDAPPRAMVSVSTDDGETWSAAVDSAIPNPGSSLEAIELGSGAWVLVLNDTPFGRGRLSAWLSEDEGETWTHKRVIEPSDPLPGRSFSYPSVIQDRDGRIHATYSVRREDGGTIREAVFTEGWIRAGE